MVIRETAGKDGPEGPGLGVLLRGVGTGGALGTISGALYMPLPAAPGLVLFAALFGLGAGLVVGFVCTATGLALHGLAERRAPALRAPAAAVGASAMVLISAASLGIPPTLRDAWPILVFTVVAAVLAVWITRPLRKVTPSRA